MKFKKLVVTYGKAERRFEFSEGTTLIFSKENSVGKSTLLRFLFYSFGYNIPGTRKISFEKAKTSLEVEIGKREFEIERYDKRLKVELLGETREFVIPDEQDELMELLFDNSNLNILDNILGAIYLDQDKGWTLLNRGIVIGSIRFNIENLIAGLANIDISEEQEKLNVYKRQLAQYKGLAGIREYQNDFLQTNTISNLSEVETINDKIAVLSSRKKIITTKIGELNQTVQKNKSLIAQIESLQLRVKIPNSNETIPVNEKTIESYEDNVEFIQTRKWSLKEEKAKLEGEIEKLQKRKLELSGQLDLFGERDEINKTNQILETISINAAAVSSKIEELTSEIKIVKEQIQKKLSSRTRLVDEMSEQILDYAARLNVEQYLSKTSNFLFMNKLKDLSGTVLHKLVLSFKLSYLKMLENNLKITLPIVLDSPGGREVTPENVSEMMEILEQDFSENQKIIASIYDDRIEINSKIILNSKEKLFEGQS